MAAERGMVRLACNAMGTRFEIALWGEDDVFLRSVGEECVREVEHWHGRLSRFAPDSDAARLSREPDGLVDAELAELLDLCEQVRVASGGGFDVRYAAGGTLDFGAVGKGWALVRITAILRDHGVTTALVHGGTSSVAAIGSPPGADGWRVDVRSDGTPLRRVLRDQVMGVSAPRGGRVPPDVEALRDNGRAAGTETAGTGTGHIINPRTGKSAAHVDTAVVIGPADGPYAAALCDAWSTALVVLGEQEVDATGIKMPVPPPLPPGFEAYIHTPRGWEHLAAPVTGATGAA